MRSLLPLLFLLSCKSHPPAPQEVNTFRDNMPVADPDSRIRLGFYTKDREECSPFSFYLRKDSEYLNRIWQIQIKFVKGDSTSYEFADHTETIHLFDYLDDLQNLSQGDSLFLHQRLIEKTRENTEDQNQIFDGLVVYIVEMGNPSEVIWFQDKLDFRENCYILTVGF